MTLTIHLKTTSITLSLKSKNLMAIANINKVSKRFSTDLNCLFP
eukprot:NP_871709.1 Uncharacterized protein CELE_Y32H12A.9 [Caenorhabditis elegans]